MKKGLTNRELRKYVDAHDNFMNKNKTCFGELNRCANVYAVFSYGYHYPMYVFDRETQRWFGNSTKSSRTTSRHKTHCRPSGDIHWLNDDQMHSLSRMGYQWLATQRILGEHA